jgi:hypothetical protein
VIDGRELFLTIQRQVTALIQGLKPDQVEYLAAGKAKLVFLPPGAQIVQPTSDVKEHLSGMRTREEAEKYLVKMKVDELKALARQLDIAIDRNDKKADLVRKIASGTVGIREDDAAIRSWRS